MTRVDNLSKRSKQENLINYNFFTGNVIEVMKQKYETEEAFKSDDYEMIKSPYKVIYFHGILESNFASYIRDELKNLEYREKNNDLYKFYQSYDLKSSHSTNINNLTSLIYSKKFLGVLTGITGVLLNDTVDISASKYELGNYLLCHDDDIQNTIDGRRLAFIIYFLDDDWCSDDGGLLQLFKCNSQNEPDEIVEQIVPRYNSMIIFEIGNFSFHQVSEVLSNSKNRYSVVGWFHGPLNSQIDMPLSYKTELKQFINKEYLVCEAIQNIKTIFLEESVIELREFILPHLFDEIGNELEDSIWEYVEEPLNVKKYQGIKDIRKHKLLKRLKMFFESLQFREYLIKLTSLNILSINKGEFRSFYCGDYTLVNDNNIFPKGLDLLFFVGRDKWDHDQGGKEYYVSGTETLLDISPYPNSLFLVYREDDTQNFTKYLTNDITQVRIDFSALYLE